MFALAQVGDVAKSPYGILTFEVFEGTPDILKPESMGEFIHSPHATYGTVAIGSVATLKFGKLASASYKLDIIHQDSFIKKGKLNPEAYLS
jgi:hypothetical protein